LTIVYQFRVQRTKMTRHFKYLTAFAKLEAPFSISFTSFKKTLLSSAPYDFSSPDREILSPARLPVPPKGRAPYFAFSIAKACLRLAIRDPIASHYERPPRRFLSAAFIASV
jgi:hypothetical protein